MLELYHDWRSFCSIKVRLCLFEKGLSWTSRFVDLLKLEHTKPDYLRVNPNGVVPTLVHDGIPIYESTIINEYLDETFPQVSLVPKHALERARMRFWVKFEDDVLHPAIRPATFALLMRPTLAALDDVELDAMLDAHPNRKRALELRAAARSPVDPEQIAQARAQMLKAVERMEAQLSRTPYLTGDQFTLADIAAAPFIDRLEELNFHGIWGDSPGVLAWVGRITSRPSYSQALPRNDQRLVPQ